VVPGPVPEAWTWCEVDGGVTGTGSGEHQGVPRWHQARSVGDRGGPRSDGRGWGGQV